MLWCICGFFGGFSFCACDITRRCWVIGVQEWSIASGCFWYRCCTWYWGCLISHFLWKWWFLSVSLPDPSTLIWYWWSGRKVMIFPIVFHWWLSGLWIAIVSSACNGERLYICYTFLLLLHCSGGGFLCGIVLPLPIQGVACRGLAVKECNRWWSSIVPVIDQYLGLVCFSTAGWPKQHCHSPRNLGYLYYHLLSSLQFLLWALPSH